MRTFIPVSALVVIALAIGTGAATAQSVGPDEAIGQNGAAVQKLELTPAQKNAIYQAVFHERVKPAPVLLSAVVGAPVPQAAELIDLPEAAGAANLWATDLKYAMVDSEVVVVDPVRMRVVDVIHAGSRP